ncbi:MAG: sulfotransferase [Parvibaculum sp.]
MSDDVPFFILGCVRSGTTLLRDILRTSTRLECPEETQYYRWGQPFGNNGFINHVLKPPLLQRHRKMDKVDEHLFEELMETSISRRNLQDRYMDAYLAGQSKEGVRWFDKSPQNVYGLPLLSHDYPSAKFVHIVRNPLNVVASLMIGKVVIAPSVIAAANYWYEAVAIFNTVRPLVAERSCELRYENLISSPEAELNRLMDFVGEDPRSLSYDFSKIHPEKDQYRTVLADADIAVVGEICGSWAEHYGYDLSVRGLEAERTESNLT